MWPRHGRGQVPAGATPLGAEEHPLLVARARMDLSRRKGANKIAERRRATSDGLQLSLRLAAAPALLQM